MIKINLKKTPEQVELIKAIGSRNKEVSAQASEAFAAFIGPIIQKVILQASTAGMIFTDSEFDEDDNPSYPLDLYYNEDAGYVTVWQQSIAGGLPSSQVEGVKEMKISTYRLDSAVSFLKKYARRSRLDVVAKALERMAQEVLIKQERNAWATVLSAVAAGKTHGLQHVIRCGTAGSFLIDDLNKLITRMKRVNSSFASGTPANFEYKGLTDLFVSTEIKEQIRSFAYNPLNTKIGVVAGTSGSGYAAQGIPLPENVREQIWQAAGMQEIFGVTITDLIELGQNQKYNTLFGAQSGSTTYTKPDGTGSATFSPSSEEILVGIDATRDAFIRPIARQAESGGQFITLPDDQFLLRQDKTGYYGFLEEGRCVLDSRAALGLIC
jgi:hypothetical protein